MLNIFNLLNDQITFFWTRVTFAFVAILLVFLIASFITTIVFKVKYLKVYNEVGK